MDDEQKLAWEQQSRAVAAFPPLGELLVPRDLPRQDRRQRVEIVLPEGLTLKRVRFTFPATPNRN